MNALKLTAFPQGGPTSRGLNHSQAHSSKELNQITPLQMNSPVPVGWKINVLHRTMGLIGAMKAAALEVNLAEPAD